ncbi:hypothetical protein QJQ45_014328 [Haematococcus lacustris]|nr:hypothetical protein QJQ45_014328 [Haematococcus lacustris]
MVTPEQRVEELQVSVRDVMKRIGMVKALPLDDPERQCLYDLDKQLTMLLKKQLLIMQEDGGCGVMLKHGGQLLLQRNTCHLRLESLPRQLLNGKQPVVKGI